MSKDHTKSSKPPEISVIMPCYNAESSVERALVSIQKQTIDRWELIVVDDGSTDDSANLVAAFSQDDLRIKLLKQPHGGVVSASNTGFGHASAPFIARMDADDTSRPDRLEKQLHYLQRFPECGAVTCLARFSGDLTTAAGYAHHVKWINRHTTAEQIRLNRFIDLPFPHPSLMYRRELIEKYGAYREGGFPEDYEMALRWMQEGVQIDKIGEVLYDWYDPSTRLSRNDTRYAMHAFHRIKAPYLARAIHESGCGERELWIWGAGRPARKCARPIEEAWKAASGFIDIDPRKIGRELHGRPVVSADALPPQEKAVILSYVGTRGARDVIRAALIKSGRTEGLDFWICA